MAKDKADELILLAEGKVNHAVGGGTSLTANLGLGVDALAKQSSITAAYVGGGGQFLTPGLKPARELARAGFGAVMNASNAMEITARYDIELRDGFRNQTVSARLKIPL